MSAEPIEFDESLNSSMGALFIGMVLGAVLWGVSCVQTWYYFDNFGKDPVYLRVTVFVTWCSDTVHQALITHAVYTYVITGFGDRNGLNTVLWSIYLEVLFNGLTGFLVQSFFVHRIWTFRRNVSVVLFISALVAAEFAVSLAYVGLGMRLKTFDELVQIKGVSMSINGLAAAGDVAISIAICTMLESSKSGFGWSNHVINRLMIFAINSGLLTSLCAIMSLICITALPDTLIYFVFYFIIRASACYADFTDYRIVYSNSLLATLNYRKSMRTPQQSSRGESHSLHDRNTSGNRLFSRVNHAQKPGIQVQIETIHQDDFHASASIEVVDPDKQSVAGRSTHKPFDVELA
ncbi:hypothetical protein CPB85DRAFT_1435349 [Mucidula mucida]|nr:hypothetical protein CPB85DRAFT_1435349 [Mucidula mucida]